MKPSNIIGNIRKKLDAWPKGRCSLALARKAFPRSDAKLMPKLEATSDTD